MPIFFESTADSIPDDPGEIVTNVARLAIDSCDVRAQTLELAHDFLVAAIEVINILENGGPPGGEGGHDERRTRADVGNGDRPAMQHAGAGHDRAAALHNDIRPQLAKFWHVLEAVFEHGLGYMAPALRLRHQADEGRLQVGRKSRMRPGGHVDRLQVAIALHPQAVRPVLYLDAGRSQLEDHGAKVGGLEVFEYALPTGRRNSERVGSRLDVVRDHSVRGAAQLGHPLDLQHIGADPVDPRPHLAEEHRQVDDVRLARRVVDGGDAVGGGGGHHQVLGPGHGRHVEVDGGALQAAGARDVLTTLELHAGAHHAQPDEVLLDAAHADVVPARLCHPGLTAPGQQRTHQKERGAHPARHRRQHLAAGEPLRVDLDLLWIEPADLDAHAFQQAHHGRDVLDPRYVLEADLLLCEQACGEDGKDRVLGATDRDPPDQSSSPLDQELGH